MSRLWQRVLFGPESVTAGDTKYAYVSLSDSLTSFHVKWDAGTQIGTSGDYICLETSNDPEPTLTSKDWHREDVTTVSGSLGDGTTAGNYVVHVSTFGSAHMRLALPVSAAGTLTVWGTGKEG